MIRIWANKLDVCVPECIQIENGMTLYDWFISDGMPTDCDYESLPISVWIEQVQVLPNAWKTTIIHPEVSVDIYREPKGTDPFSITFALLFAAKAALAAFTPKMPKMNNSQPGQGDPLDEATAKGNKVKINTPIPEIAGFNLRYPDYLAPPRRYFLNPREQWVEMLLCVGKGKYQIENNSVKVGTTELSSLGSSARYRIFGPGEDISSEAAHLIWYSAPEVNATSTGVSGLELTVGTDLTKEASASVFSYVNDAMSIPIGAGSYPSNWTSGLVVNIIAPYTYTVIDGGGDAGRDLITGGDVAKLSFVTGDVIEISGNNAGRFEVYSYKPFDPVPSLQLNYLGGTPADGLMTGDIIMAIARPGFKHKIIDMNSQLILVDRLYENETVDNLWAGWTTNANNLTRIFLDSSNLQGGYRGAFPACPENEVVTQIEWDVFFSQGLVGIGREGQEYQIGSSHIFEYRDMAIGGIWLPLQKTCIGSSMDAQGFTFREVLPYPMRPECRIKRLPPQGSSGRNNEAKDNVVWYGLRGLSTLSKNSYADATVMTVYIRGGDRISNKSESLINVECTRILPELDGSGNWGLEVPTRKISSWIGHVCRNIGYADSDINLTELQRLENIWSTRGDTYDNIVNTASTVKDNLIETLYSGFSELSINNGQITPVRDQLQTGAYRHIYNPQNMREPLKDEFVALDYDDFDGIVVEYTDEKTWTDLSVECFVKSFPGLPDDLGTKTFKIKLKGVHNRNKAYQIGMRERMRQIFQKRNYSFSTEWSALNSSYGDYVALGDNTPGYAQSARLKSFLQVGDVYVLMVGEKMIWDLTGANLVGIRRDDGSLSGPFDAVRLDDYRMTILKSDFDAEGVGFFPDFTKPNESPFIQFGPEGIWCYPALITEVNPRGTKYCEVKALNYDPRIYHYDDALADN